MQNENNAFLEELVFRLQRGDESALWQLWEHVKRFALAIVRRYTPTSSVDVDDLLQCAFLGVRAAAFAHDGWYAFLSLIAWAIRRECGMRSLWIDVGSLTVYPMMHRWETIRKTAPFWMDMQTKACRNRRRL